MDAGAPAGADISPGGSSGETAGAPDSPVSCANPRVPEIRTNTKTLRALVHEMRLAKIVILSLAILYSRARQHANIGLLTGCFEKVDE